MKKFDFAHVAQLGILTPDARKLVAHYAEMGVGPWKVYAAQDDPEHIGGMVVARGWIDGFELELIQPGGDASFHYEHLQRLGQSPHHLLLKTDNEEEYLSWYQQFAEKNYEILMESVIPTSAGGIKYIYFDTVKDLGVIWELAYWPEGSEEAWGPYEIVEAKK